MLKKNRSKIAMLKTGAIEELSILEDID